VRAGDLYVANLGRFGARGSEQGGTRPVVVVHGEQFGRIPSLALVCPLTVRRRGVPNHVPVLHDEVNGLRDDCFVMTEQIRAIDHRFLLAPIGAVGPAVLDRVLMILKDRLLAA
jgi:mRNA interferase MazF